MSSNDEALRHHVQELLRGEHAHVSFESAVRDFPMHLAGTKLEGIPYTAWQLLEHLRISQWDILEFSRDAKHVSPEWPAGYWPHAASPPQSDAWERSVQQFRRDLQAMVDLVADPANDLYARIPHGTGQTLLREALLVADHNAYHLGQLVLVRRMLGAWK